MVSGNGKQTAENTAPIQSAPGADQAPPNRGALTPQYRFPLKRFITIITAIGFLIIAMIALSANTALQVSQRYSPLIDAAMEIKLEATVGHLWFEEILSNDRNEDINDVRAHLALADWYALAMLEGGQNDEGVFVPLDDPVLRAHIESVRALLQQFTAQMEHRWRNHRTSGPGTAVDQDFDHTFNTFIAKADIVETRLQELTKTAERHFIIVQIILAVITLIVMAVLGVLFVRFFNIQNKTLQGLRNEISQRKKIEITLREQATTDTLTGLLNRRSMNDFLTGELRRSLRLGTPFSIIMFDLDHFKKINDTHGHDVGDEVLKMIASMIKSRLREVDALARWGGEEFLIVLPGTALGGALALSNICRELLSETRLDTVGQVTASFGVAEHKDGEAIREMLQRADEALYEAKSLGRNRVESAAA